MSGGSIGTIVGGIVGAVVGYFVPGVGAWNGAQLGMMVGGAAGNALDPPKGPNNTGPRLGDLTVQTSTYGATIPRTYGTLALFGNVFWLENNKLKEVATTESAGGKGMPGMGGGGETTTYSYFATFALGLCEGPIIGVKRIWIGPKLFYDIGTTDRETLLASKENAQYFRLYLGTEDQEADTRMQATLGAANVPGYRGLAYLVFYDLPLADYGNTLLAAQIKVEVVKHGALSDVFDLVSTTVTPASGLGQIKCMTIWERYAFIGAQSGYVYIYDTIDPENPVLLSSTLAGSAEYLESIAVNWPYLYVAGSNPNGVNIFNISNPMSPVVYSVPGFAVEDPLVVAIDSAGYVYIGRSDGSVRIYDLSDPDDQVLLYDGVLCAGAVINIEISGDTAYMLDGSDTLTLVSITEPTMPLVLSTLAVDTDASDMAVNGDYVYVVSKAGAGELQIIDVSDSAALVQVGSIVAEIGGSGGPSDVAVNEKYAFISSFFGDDLSIFNIEDPTAPYFVATLDPGINPDDLAISGSYIYLITHYDHELKIFFFIESSISHDTVPLSEIVSAEALQSQLLEASDIDVTSLTPEVRGYRVSEVAAIRAGIEPLRAAWPFDVVQHGYQIKFVLRGTSSVATITEGELDAREAGAQPGVQITNSREMDYILPRKVSIRHFDVNREYDTGEQYAERINTDAVNMLNLELSIVLTAEEAAQKAEVLLYLYWMERYDIAFNLPPDYSELEPSDVITVTTDDATYELRLTSIAYTADGRLECKAKYNSAALYIPSATGEEGQSTGVTLVLRGETLVELLDIPLLQDVYDMPGFPVAMTGYLSGWPGGVLFRSDDEGQAWTAVQGFTAPGSTIGYATNAMTEHGGTVLDKSSVLSVRLHGQGTLSSVTEAQMFAGSNWFAYGADGRWEIIAAQNCVLQGDGSYVITDFLRGQMGTEWATGLHELGDKFIALSSSQLAFLNVNSSSIGLERLYRAVTRGDTIDSADNRAFTYNGVNLECLSPCHLTGSRHPTTGDWTLTWMRRSRFAGWRSLVDAALGEVSEAYEIDIFSDDTFETVVRTLTSSTSSVAYTGDDQASDFGGVLDGGIPVTITNPGGETGNASGWTSEIGALTAVASGHSGSFCLFAGAGAEMRARQRFDLVTSGLVGGDIDAAKTYANLSGWLRGYSPGDADKAQIGLRFLNASSVEVSTIWTTLTDYSTTWVQASIAGIIPTGARYVDILLHGVRSNGTNCDAYFDDLELTLYNLIGAQTTLYLEIYQISAAVGRGYPLTATISR
jgi:hypothetical protein